MGVRGWNRDTLTDLIQSLKGDFCLKLLEWVKEEGMSEAIVLTSSHAHERRDSQIRGYVHFLKEDTVD